MPPDFHFCPCCATSLSKNDEGRLFCSTADEGCGWTNYDNPVPVVATLVPFHDAYVSSPVVAAVDVLETGLLLVRRGVEPYKGEWCLPCGYLDSREHPKAAAAREVREETGIEVRLEKLLCVCNPAPNNINQIVVSYLGRPIGGQLRAGDDAMEAKIFSRSALPDICFSSHRILVDRWYNGELGSITGTDLRI